MVTSGRNADQSPARWAANVHRSAEGPMERAHREIFVTPKPRPNGPTGWDAQQCRNLFQISASSVARSFHTASKTRGGAKADLANRHCPSNGADPTATRYQI